MQHSMVDDLGAVTAVSPQTVAASAVVGAVVDTAGFDCATLAVTAGTITDGSYAVTVAESDDPGMAGASAVPATRILRNLPAFAATDDGATKRFGVIGLRRYLQVTVTPTGATQGGVFSAVAVLGRPATAPVQ